MAQTGTATAALEDLAETATCDYVLWVGKAAARDTVVAKARWRRVVAERGFTPCAEPVLIRAEFEWYIGGKVRPAVD
jgi:hypothetical protein